MCLRDGARCGSRGGLRRAAWPGWGGWWRPSGGWPTGGTHGAARGASDAGPSADAAAAPDATATPDANSSPDAAGAASADATAAADAADAAAAQHGRHAGAATEFSASQYGRHAQHVAAVAAERRCPARPINAAATWHGIAATGSRIDGAWRNGWPGCRRHEPADRAPREYRRHDSAEPAARWSWQWVGWAQSARWAERRRRQSPRRRFCQSAGGSISPAGSAARRDRPASGWHRSRWCHNIAWSEWWGGRPPRAVHATP